MNKGHIKDVNKGHKLVSNNGVLFEIFINKTQKITSALYLVTDFISNDDPIKLKLREKSLFILSELSNLSYSEELKLNKNTNFLKVLHSISEEISLLEVSMMGGLISEMNALILKKEYTSLRSEIELKKKELLKDIVFNNDFFKVSTISSESPKFLSTSDPDNSNKYNDILKNKDSHNTINTRHNSSNLRVEIKEPKTKESAFKQKESNDLVIGNRRDSILNLLKENKGELSVSDIAIHVKGYSEKTLQRDLISMVNEGLISKNGERRWSRYSMK